MPLNTANLQDAIKSALDKQAAKDSASDDPAVSRQEIAADIAAAIEAFVKSGIVNTNVTGTSPSGPVSGTGVGSIS